ncbi:Uncharacterised protein [Bordetella pertussis]|nr:Uncharacterised protein [Bordetella pertussis]
MHACACCLLECGIWEWARRTARHCYGSYYASRSACGACPRTGSDTCGKGACPRRDRHP